MTLFNMMKRSKPRSAIPRSKSGYSNPRSENADFKPKFSNVKQNLDKHLGLAREAITTGDRITAESHYQHAEHYLRVINEIKAQQPIIQTSEPQQSAETPSKDCDALDEKTLITQEIATSSLESPPTEQTA